MDDTGVIADHEEIAHVDAACPIIPSSIVAHVSRQSPRAQVVTPNGPRSGRLAFAKRIERGHVYVAVAYRERAQGLTL